VLNLLIDTSTWLDLAKRRDGQRLIVPLRVFSHQNKLKLLVPAVVIDEFKRNRLRIEQSMTASVSERFRLIKRDLDDFGGAGVEHAMQVLDELAHQLPLIGAMTTRNFDEILDLLIKGEQITPTDDERGRVVQRGLDKVAPFHRSRNSVADALLIELYASASDQADLSTDPHGFVTSNSDDFSAPQGDKRGPHPDLANIFGAGSSYGLGVDGLKQILAEELGEELEELFAETDFVEEPRRLGEIQEAENELFDRIWYYRSLHHEYQLEEAGDGPEIDRLLVVAGPARRRVEATYTEPGQLGPYTDFELGMLEGKLSALRWVLGSEWDFLDT
jgi:hypothetical protein